MVVNYNSKDIICSLENQKKINHMVYHMYSYTYFWLYLNTN